MLPRGLQQSSTNPVRSAAIAFIRGTSIGWGKRELATWLVCHYSPCLAVDAAVHPDGRALGRSPGAASLPEECVELLVLETRRVMLRLLPELASPARRSAIAARAIAQGAVLELAEPHGDRSWVPVGRRKMRLANRVGSLFIADALNHAADYRSVAHCRDCGELGFSEPVAHDLSCTFARRVA